MIIPDTSIWIEFFKANPLVHSALSNFMEKRIIIAVECIFAELLQGVKHKKERTLIEKYWRYLPKYESRHLMIEAGFYSSENKLISQGVGLIDSIIIVSAIKSGASIWTLDKKLKNCIPDQFIFPKVEY
ncbi:MAG: PIN domain-containing protein [Calditrichaeota bacterium]|nr:PIN domain-containing protein [Calditrichota bacterium]